MTDSGDLGPDPARDRKGAVPLPPGYVAVGRLGVGGFATVWLAEQGRLGRRVAVKVLGSSVSDPETERRFLAECRAIGTLSGHPSVVTVHDAGTTDEGRPYLVMEHLPGGSVQDRLAASGALAWPEAVEVAIAVADALAAAHDAGILHRDVKPANVLIDGHGRPKLGDFGIARLAEGAHTATGSLVGTIPYTPPEVLSGQKAGATADVWALGATLHTLLTGSGPFSGDRDESPAATIARVLGGEVPPLPPSVPTEVATLVRACLAADPATRPQSAAAVVAALQGIQAGRGLPVTAAVATRSSTPSSAAPDAPTVVEDGVDPPTIRSTGPTEVAGPAPYPPASSPPTPPAARLGTPAPAPPSPGAGRAPRRRRGRLVAMLGGLVVLALVAGAVVLLSRGDDDSAAPTTDGEVPAGEDDRLALAGIDGLPLPVPDPPAATPTERWAVPVDCAAGCVAAGTSERAVVVQADGRVVALDARADDAGAATLWTTSVEPLLGSPRIEVLDHVILVGFVTEGDEHAYTALDPDTGAVRWEVAIPDLAAVGPVHDAVADTIVFRGADPDDTEPDGLDVGSTHVVDGSTGEIAWWVRGHVVGVTDELVVVADGQSIRARERGTGAVRWDEPVASGPMVATQGLPRAALLEDVLVAVADSEVVGLALDDGTERWRRDLPFTSRPGDGSGAVVAVPGDDDGAPVVVVSGDRGHSGYDVDGTERWTEVGLALLGDAEVPFWVGGSGRFLVAGEDGQVSLFAPDGTLDEEVDLGTVPGGRSWGVNDGQLVAVTDEGVVGLGLAALAQEWSISVDATLAVPVREGVLIVSSDAATLHRSPA